MSTQANRTNMKVLSKDFFGKNDAFKGAEYDSNGRRITLSRQWEPNKPVAQVISHCPSTASANTEDMTTKRLRVILGNLGYGGYYLINAGISFKRYIKRGQIDTIIAWGADVRKSKQTGKYRKSIKRRCTNIFQFCDQKRGSAEVMPTRLANNTQLTKLRYLHKKFLPVV